MKAWDIAKSTGDTYSMAISKSGMGYISYAVRDYPAAYVNYADALDLLEKSDTVDYYNRTNILRHMAMIHSRFRNHDQSIEYRKRTWESIKEYVKNDPEDAKEAGVMHLLVDTPYYLAVEYDKKGAHESAGKILLDLWTKAEKEGNIKLHARVLNKLGLIKMNNGELTAAQEYFGLVATEEQVSEKYQAAAYHNLANTYMLQGNYKRAELYFKIALDKKLELGSPRDIFITYLDMGELEYKRNKLEEAISYWDTGLSVFDKVDNDPELYVIYNWLQLAYMEKDVQQAKAYNELYTQASNFYVGNQKYQRAEEENNREALSKMIDQKRQERVDAADRERFIQQFWPLILGIVLLVFFSAILGMRYYMSTKVKALKDSNLRLEKAKAILKSVDELD